MKVAVVILNWNGRKLLEQFLPSVIEYSDLAEIYVADNDSSDGSVVFIKEYFPTVKIIRNDVNGGYAKGYNEALSDLEEDIFVLLNNDVEVSEGWLEPLIRLFEVKSNCVAAQPKILDYNKRDHFEYAGAAGGFVDKLGYPYCRGRIFNELEKDTGQFNDTSEIFWATGAALFVRKDAFRETGGFDEDLFAHQEEIDLCWRLQKNGGKIYYCGHSEVYHLGGGTLSAANPRKTFYNFRNTLLVLYKNVSGSKIYRLLFTRLVLDGVAAFMFIFQGKFSHFLAIIRAHFSFYSLIGKFRSKRKRWKSNLQYAVIKSVVWKYFIAKKRTFNEL